MATDKRVAIRNAKAIEALAEEVKSLSALVKEALAKLEPSEPEAEQPKGKK